MGHPKQPTPVAKDNSVENSIVNGTTTKNPEQSTQHFIGFLIGSDKTTSIYFWGKIRKNWMNNSQNNTLFGTTEIFSQQY